MNPTHMNGTATGPNGESRRLEFLLDSGATYTVLPYAAWNALGVVTKRQMRIVLVDGTQLVRDVGECRVALDCCGVAFTPVVLGVPGDVAILGAVTLHELGYVLNPFSRELCPAEIRLAALGRD